MSGGPVCVSGQRTRSSWTSVCRRLGNAGKQLDYHVVVVSAAAHFRHVPTWDSQEHRERRSAKSYQEKNGGDTRRPPAREAWARGLGPRPRPPLAHTHAPHSRVTHHGHALGNTTPRPVYVAYISSVAPATGVAHSLKPRKAPPVPSVAPVSTPASSTRLVLPRLYISSRPAPSTGSWVWETKPRIDTSLWRERVGSATHGHRERTPSFVMLSVVRGMLASAGSGGCSHW